MKQVLRLLKEDDRPGKKKPTIWQHFWTVRLFKSPYAPMALTLFGFVLAISCIYLSVKSEGWLLKMIVVKDRVPAANERDKGKKGQIALASKRRAA